jgi:hypothetical protein
MTKTPKRPRDLNAWAKRMVDIATGEVEDREPALEERGKKAQAVAAGRLGGKIGGKARARALSAKERHLSAQRAARARWAKD